MLHSILILAPLALAALSNPAPALPAATPAAIPVPEPAATLVVAAEPPLAPAARPTAGSDGPDGPQGPELTLFWGTFGILDTEVIFEGGLEYRFAERELFDGFRLAPIVGASLLADGGTYVFAGARHEHELGGGFFLAPSFAAGIYQEGGVDLGGPLEFRSGLDLGVRPTDELELTAGIYHLSNGGLYSLNGGAESALFGVTFGL
ncbi:MAG: acyloxyacyl hydrolase [Planctomycetota bacterium]